MCVLAWILWTAFTKSYPPKTSMTMEHPPILNMEICQCLVSFQGKNINLSLTKSRGMPTWRFNQRIELFQGTIGCVPMVFIVFSRGSLGIITHKYQLHRAYIGTSHRGTLVRVHPTIPWLSLLHGPQIHHSVCGFNIRKISKIRFCGISEKSHHNKKTYPQISYTGILYVIFALLNKAI